MDCASNLSGERQSDDETSPVDPFWTSSPHAQIDPGGVATSSSNGSSRRSRSGSSHRIPSSTSISPGPYTSERRGFKATAVAFARKGRNSTNTTPPRTPSSNVLDVPPHNLHAHFQTLPKRRRSWRTAFLAMPIEHTKLHGGEAQHAANRRPYQYDPAIPHSSLNRRRSKLQKRPPEDLPARRAAVPRMSTYSEWRRSMVMEVSADVSRKSSQRSKRSTLSRASSTAAFASATSNADGPKSGFARKNSRRKGYKILKICRKIIMSCSRCGSHPHVSERKR
jgi:hypothetical protein